MIGVIGGCNAQNPTHIATSRALEMLPGDTSFEWIATDELSNRAGRLDRVDGFLIAPAKPLPGHQRRPRGDSACGGFSNALLLWRDRVGRGLFLQLRSDVPRASARSQSCRLSSARSCGPRTKLRAPRHDREHATGSGATRRRGGMMEFVRTYDSLIEDVWSTGGTTTTRCCGTYTPPPAERSTRSLPHRSRQVSQPPASSLR